VTALSIGRVRVSIMQLSVDNANNYQRSKTINVIYRVQYYPLSNPICFVFNSTSNMIRRGRAPFSPAASATTATS